ncbi:helix-turn-helix domain-containing protein [Parabacteroides faecis]
MAHQCHIRKDLVNKTLKAKYDLTFSNYLKEKRIKYACTLLLDPSNMKIDVISDASGFKTTRTFVRSFRSVKNVSPTEYRHLQVFKRNMFC